MEGGPDQDRDLAVAVSLVGVDPSGEDEHRLPADQPRDQLPGVPGHLEGGRRDLGIGDADARLGIEEVDHGAQARPQDEAEVGSARAGSAASRSRMAAAAVSIRGPRFVRPGCRPR